MYAPTKRKKENVVLEASGRRALGGTPRRTMGERMEKREEHGKEQHRKRI